MSDVLATMGRVVLERLGPVTLGAAALLCAALAADWLLQRRVGAGWRVVLYLAVVARALAPASWTSPIGVVPALEVAAPGTPMVVEDPGALHPIVAPASTAPVSAGPPEPERWDPATAAGVAYLFGVALLLGRWGRARLQLQVALRDVSAPGHPLSVCAQKLTVVEHPTLGPFVAGWLRPRVVVPAALVGTLDQEALGLVLAHERGHLARRDHLLIPALQLACIIAWPILPVWLASRRVRLLIERACDERALAGASSAVRARYGALLVALAGGRHDGVVAAFGSDLRGRLYALRFRRRWPVAFQPVLVGALVLWLGAATGHPRATAAPSPAPAGVVGPAVWRALGAGERTAAMFDRYAATQVRVTSGRADPSAVLTALLGLDAQNRPILSRLLESYERDFERRGEEALDSRLGGQLNLLAMMSIMRQPDWHLKRPFIERCAARANEPGHPRAPRVAGTFAQVAFTLGAEGRARDVKLLGSNTGSKVFDLCVVEVLPTVALPRPLNGRPATVQVDLHVSKPENSGTVVSDLGLTKPQIREAIRSRKPDFDACHQRALEKDPWRALSLRLGVTVGPGGVVSAVVPLRFRNGERERDEVECLLGVIRATRFPVPSTGKSVRFEFPLEFAPLR